MAKFLFHQNFLQKKLKNFIFAPMKRTLHILLTALVTLLYGVSEAQIIFDKKNHDFGEIAEDGGAVEHIFKFSNTSTKPVVILSTHTSCGCTTTEYSRKPVLPGESSSVKVVFNPMNYPGAFARKVTIVTSEGTVKEPLLITGKVTPRKLSLEERYPLTLIGGVRTGNNAHAFGYVEHGKMIQSSFEIFNSSQRRVKLAIENPYPELEFYYPTTLDAGAEAAINFSCLLPENSTVYGSLSYAVWLVVDGKKVNYPFIINGLAIDSRDENANNRAQMIAMSENFIKFGAVKCSVAKAVRELRVYNRGNKALRIRKVELEREGFSARLEGDSTIKPGESRVIKVEINPSRLPFGAVVEKMRIVSDDPKSPVLTIRVSAIVEG